MTTQRCWQSPTRLAVGLLALCMLAGALTACESAQTSAPRARATKQHPRQETTPKTPSSKTPKPSKTTRSAEPTSSGHTPQKGPSVAALAKGPISTGWRVSRVVDGDTVEVVRGRRTLTLRLIGIDTPETVDPSKPVQCFGPAASSYANRQLLGEPVVLEFDRSQGRLDYYGRTLAYLWVRGDGSPWLFDQRVVRLGYAREYTYDTVYAWQAEFMAAERQARANHRGLWKACRHTGS